MTFAFLEAIFYRFTEVHISNISFIGIVFFLKPKGICFQAKETQLQNFKSISNWYLGFWTVPSISAGHLPTRSKAIPGSKISFFSNPKAAPAQSHLPSVTPRLQTASSRTWLHQPNGKSDFPVSPGLAMERHAIALLGRPTSKIICNGVDFWGQGSKGNDSQFCSACL